MFPPGQAEAFVAAIRREFPHLEAMTWGPHVAVWHPDAVRAIMEGDQRHYGSDPAAAIQRAAETDEIGELLGNGARTLSAGDAVVRFFVDGEQVAGGFVSRLEDVQSIGQQRRAMFEIAFGETVEMDIHERSRPL